MDLLDLIICTECKTRVEYHEEPDGYMSCECWVRTHQDEPMPEKWIEIEDMKANLCGICRQDINERLIFRCADCGLPFHQVCLDHHCKHGNQKQELRSENLFLKEQLKAALAAKEKAEGALCRAREALRKGLSRCQYCYGTGTGWDGGVCLGEVCLTMREALSSSAPCSCAAELERVREALNISPDEVGRIMHESWTRTKRAQGYHHPREVHGSGFNKSLGIWCDKCHADLIPWESLPEGQKDINRHAFDDVLTELRRRASK